MSTTLSSLGEQVVLSGGTASFTTVAGGELYISGGKTISTTCRGVEYVYSGGTAMQRAAACSSPTPPCAPDRPCNTMRGLRHTADGRAPAPHA